MMPRADTQRRTPSPAARPRSARWPIIGIGAGLLGQAAAGHLNSAFGEALATACVVAPMIIALVLLAAILRGSRQTCERAFRLLRWITNRPEPPAPCWTSPTRRVQQRNG